MDETNLAPEAALKTARSVTAKGCYIGQEVIARIRTYGQVAKALRGLRLADDLKRCPSKGTNCFTTAKKPATSPAPGFAGAQGNIALGYVRKEANQIGTEFTPRNEYAGDSLVAPLPFQGESDPLCARGTESPELQGLVVISGTAGLGVGGAALVFSPVDSSGCSSSCQCSET